MKIIASFASVLALAVPAMAQAGNAVPVRLTNQVFLEQQRRDSDGAVRTLLAPADRFASGDKLIFVTRYRNEGSRPLRNVVVSHSRLSHVRIEERARGGSMEFSVDGGTRWGPLRALSVPLRGGQSRPATSEDVTHVRWVLAEPIAPGAEGQFSYRGTVR